MHSVSILLVVSLVFLLLVVLYATSLPRDFPRNIPYVPLWRHALDIAKGTSRADLYNARIREPMEKHGAVVRWHEGRWTILVTKPEFLTHVFKNSQGILIRNGFYHRDPGSNAAHFFGENIIDSDGELHSQFAKLLKPGILRPIDVAHMREKSQLLATRLWEDYKASPSPAMGLQIGEQVWRWALNVFASFFLDTEMNDLDYSETAVQQILRAQNHAVLGRLRDIFPLLDLIPYKPSLFQQTRALFVRLEENILDHVERRLKGGPPLPGDENKLIYILDAARKSDLISDFHYRSNINQLFVAGHENAETTLVSAMLELATRPDIQTRLYTELSQGLRANYGAEDLDRMPLLSAVLYETLRLYPPLGTLTNRRTTEPFLLGSDIFVPPGTLIGWHAYGVHTDPQVWGDNARQFDPDRWGKDPEAIHWMFRTQQAKGRYIPFGIYSRRCLGSAFALTQLRVALCELVRSFEWELPADHVFSFSLAVLVAPDDCTLILRKRAG